VHNVLCNETFLAALPISSRSKQLLDIQLLLLTVLLTTVFLHLVLTVLFSVGLSRGKFYLCFLSWLLFLVNPAELLQLRLKRGV
jgi:hypothetical protein